MRKKIEVTFIPRTSNDHLIESICEAFKKIFLKTSSSNKRGKQISNMLIPRGKQISNMLIPNGGVYGGKIHFTFFLHSNDGNFTDSEAAVESIIDKAVAKIEFKAKCSIDQVVQTN